MSKHPRAYQLRGNGGFGKKRWVSPLLFICSSTLYENFTKSARNRHRRILKALWIRISVSIRTNNSTTYLLHSIKSNLIKGHALPRKQLGAGSVSASEKLVRPWSSSSRV